MPDLSDTSFVFGAFRLDPVDRSLWRNDKPVNLPPKALDVLTLLVQRAGQIVSREDLLSTVWPDTFVEEGNINVIISLLRKTLGDKKLIQTVPRRGYRFSGHLEQTADLLEKPVGEIDLPGTSPVTVATKARKTSRKSAFVAAACVVTVILGTIAYFSVGRVQTAIPPYSRNIQTLAVMPLKSIAENDVDNAIAIGVTDSLISRLASLRKFTVRPLSAVERFARGKMDVVEAGTELKCDAVIVGTYQSIEGRLRVNLRLLDVRDGAQLWTASFDEPNGDIFALQDQIALEVAGSLLQQLSQSDEQALGKRYTENREAYLAYLRGRTVFNRRVDGGFQRSLDEYQRALTLDPAFPLAYTGLADLYSRQGNGASGKQADEAYKTARAYIVKALDLDSELSEAHSSLARLKRTYEWDWPGAEKEFKRAIELDPSNAVAIAWYAQMLSFLGRHDEALTMIERAAAVDPISPAIVDVKLPILEASGRLDEGLKLAEERYRNNKENMTARRAYSAFLYHAGQYDRAIAVATNNTSENKGKDFVWFSLLAAAYSKAGNPEMAGSYITQLEEMSTDNTKALYSLAVVYAELGRADDAFDMLEKCFEQHEERLVWMNVEPRLVSIRNDARFRSIVDRLQLDPNQ
ncbi:MAG: tetratricopeptide repeat protein [Pyrinomonadaceae bacterium]